MTGTRRVALLGGTAYLATFVLSIPAVPLYAPVTDDPGYVLGTGADTRILFAGLLEFLTALACVATALALYPVLRRAGRTAAVGFLSSRIVEAGLILVGVVSILSVVTLRQDLGAGEEPAAGLLPVAHALVAVRDWTFLLGPGVMPAVNAAFLATVLYRTGLVPRVLPLIGLIGAPLLLIKSGIVFFGGMSADVTVAAGLLTLPIAAWEFGLGVWLVAKGFRPSPVLAGEES